MWLTIERNILYVTLDHTTKHQRLSSDMQQRQLIHSFPRPKAGDSNETTLERALNILSLIKKSASSLRQRLLNGIYQQSPQIRRP